MLVTWYNGGGGVANKRMVGWNVEAHALGYVQRGTGEDLGRTNVQWACTQQ
jgi:hypothetical protein